MTTLSSKLTTCLIKNKLINEKEMLQATKSAQNQGISFVRFIVENHLICSDKIMHSFAAELNLPIFDLNNYSSSTVHQFPLSAESICQYRILPLKISNNILSIGLSDPTDQFALDAIIFLTGLRLNIHIVDEKKLTILLEKIAHLTDHLELSLLQKISLEQETPQLHDQANTEEEPLIQFVDRLLQHARQLSASDIHIEPFATGCRIRYRRDGILHEVTRVPIELTARLLSRLKIMAKLDIAEKRLPQDGRMHSAGIDIRISSCPTFFGEKIVLRLLDINKITLNLDKLGFNILQKNIFLKNISNAHGLILVTGPTGCGKTSTLYSALHYLNTPAKNISTVEDPVEIQLEGINQVNILPKIGLDFVKVLRTLLRQDPDIIMVGEIRDRETATIAIQAAQTGHLVLSTLHTKNAIETIARLISMNISSYNILNAISLIVAQRLIRQLCPICKQPENYNGQTIFKENGCQECYFGFKGRTGIYEFLSIDEKIAECILANTNMQKIYNQWQQDNNQTLYQAGFEKVLAGTTSLSELQRVLQC